MLTITAPSSPPDHSVEGWLKILDIESLCQWDVLVFLHRHQTSLVSAEHIARFLGYPAAEVVAALNRMESAGLAQRSRAFQGVRLHRVAAPADAARRDALGRLLPLADGQTVRLFLARRRRGSDQPGPNNNDLRSRGAKGRDHD